MKTFTHQSCRLVPVFVIMTIILLSPNSIYSENISLNNGKNNLIVKENTYNRLQIANSLSVLDYFVVKTDRGNFTGLFASSYSNTLAIGSPKLPVLRRLIEIPFGANPEVRIISSDYEDYSLSELGILYTILPTQPPVPKNNQPLPPFEYNAAVYNTDAFYGEEMASVDVLGIMRGVRIGRLNIAPVQYNPVTQTLRIYKEIEVAVIFRNANIQVTIQEKQKNASPYFIGLNQMFINYKTIQNRDTVTKYPVKYVIVSDPMFHDQLQPFIAWKIKKGFTVVEAYTDDPQVGNTLNSIKTYIESLYDSGTPENPAPSFVLLVGDVAQIPAWELSGESDLKYCEYTGDYFPEIYYGRFSAQNPTQLQPQIDKTLEVEQFTMPDPSYLGEVVMIGGMDGSFGPDWANGQINYGTENYFNEAHGILSHTYLYPESGSHATDIIQDVSNGVGYGNYTAHGSSSGWADPSFSVSDIPTLQNQNKYGLLVGNACSTNEYATPACFGEALLRAENKGAVGYIGGSNSTYWDEDYYWGVGVGPITEDPPSYYETTLGSYDRMFHDHGEPQADWYTTQDQMIFAGNLAVTEGAPGSAQYYWEIYCLMGDPSLSPYMGVPAEMTISYDQLMPMGSTSFTVTAEPYALVAISKDGVLYGATVADESGIADVALTPITVPGSADIVVTNQNRQPFAGTVVVASPEGPYVLLNSISINDQSGNGNGMADYSENVLLDVTLENVGNSDATNLTVLLTSTDPYIEITINNCSWDDIQSGGTVTKTGAFSFHVKDSIPDQHKAIFTISITNGSEVWSSNFPVTLCAPILNIGNMVIHDNIVGNGNGRLDPGEMAEIVITASNTGHCDASSVTGTLTSTSEYLILNSNSSSLGALPYGQSVEAVFTVTVNPSAQIGTVADLIIKVESTPYIAEKPFNTKIGLVVEDFETGDFTSFDWQFGGDADWIVTDNQAYSGVHSAVSGDIGDSQSSTLLITFEVPADDSLSFFRKVSSEDSYDYLNFYIDDVKVGEWSGEKGWERFSYSVSAGSHTFKWEYSKDYSYANGSDCAWIDYVVLPSVGGASGPLSLSAVAYPAQICFGSDAQLFALPSGGLGTYTYLWSPSATLNDPTVFNPVATPSETTLYSVQVSDGLDTLSAEVTLPVLALPEAPVITQEGEQLVSSIETGNQWYIWGQPIEGATEQMYTPVTTGEYSATVSNEIGCESAFSNAIYFIYTAVPELEKNNLLSVFPNPFTDHVIIRYTLDQTSDIDLRLFNSMGIEMGILVNTKNQPAGNYSYTLYSSGLQAGIYYCRLEADNQTIIKKLILTK
jgi:hypothetical protein